MDQHDTSPAEPPAAAPPFQFSLKGLLVVLTVVSVLCALAIRSPVLCGFCIATMLGVGLYFRRSRVVYAVLAVFFLAGMCLLPFGGSARYPARRAQCQNNMKQIGLALQNYHDYYGTFPPAYIADAKGKPIHSWRVLILPFAEHADLYERYSFDEPWDGPNNSRLANEFPAYLGCPAAAGAQFTSYVAIVGPETAWPGDKTVSAAEITDGLNETILVVEIAGSNIHWMEPRDLDIGAVNRGSNPKTGKGISSGHPRGSNVLLTDGSVRFLPQLLYPLFTIQGGEKVSDKY